MSLNVFGAALLAIFTSTAFGQVTAAPKYSDADLVRWAAFFFRVTWLEDIADRDAANAANGYKRAPMRSLIQREATLTTAETAVVKATSLDWKDKMAPITYRARALMKTGASAKTSPELMALRNARDAMVADHIERIRAALGPVPFARLNYYVHIPRSGPGSGSSRPTWLRRSQ